MLRALRKRRSAGDWNAGVLNIDGQDGNEARRRGWESFTGGSIRADTNREGRLQVTLSGSRSVAPEGEEEIQVVTVHGLREAPGGLADPLRQPGAQGAEGRRRKTVLAETEE